MAKADQDKKNAEKRFADARKATAGELGEVDNGWPPQLPPRELKALLAEIMNVGPA